MDPTGHPHTTHSDGRENTTAQQHASILTQAHHRHCEQEGGVALLTTAHPAHQHHPTVMQRPSPPHLAYTGFPSTINVTSLDKYTKQTQQPATATECPDCAYNWCKRLLHPSSHPFACQPPCLSISCPPSKRFPRGPLHARALAPPPPPLSPHRSLYLKSGLLTRDSRSLLRVEGWITTGSNRYS